MIIAVTGGTGFVGSALVDALRKRGVEVRVLSRSRGPHLWNPLTGPPDGQILAGVDAVIHLAGEPVAQRWTAGVKKKIRDSRVSGTHNLMACLRGLEKRPEVLVCASAVGFYGSRGEEVLDEASRPGEGFLPEVCVEWEREAQEAESLGMRAVRLRIGVVLHPAGGALKKMLPPFRLGLGGPVGDGRQWMPWIHREDLIGLILFALDNPALRGPVNATSPQPVSNRDFSAALGAALHRPAVLPVPGFALKVMFGEMAEVVLGSQRVVPTAALAARFVFRHPEIGPALKSLLSGG